MKSKVIIAALALVGCSEPSAQSAQVENTEIVEPALPPAPTAPAAPVSKWSYSTDTDEMRGTSETYAQLASEGVVPTNWPYDAAPMRMVVRKRSTDGVNVMLQINGQFLCRSYDATKITVKFDDGPLETFRCAEADSGPNDVVFITPPRSFIGKLKAAKTMMLEAPIYEIGNAQVTFNVAGLEWED